MMERPPRDLYRLTPGPFTGPAETPAAIDEALAGIGKRTEAA